MKEGDGAYAIAGAFLISAIILSATIIYAVGNVNMSLQQVRQGLSEVKVGLAAQQAAPSGNGAQLQPTVAPVAPTPVPTQAPTGKVSFDSGVWEGKKDAPVVLVEYSDFQCPFCQRFYSATYGQLKKDYVDTGKIALVFKHFPLDQIHPNARPAARAAECAKDQGKFFEYHDKLFTEQQLDEAGYKKYATDLKLDMTKFNACLAKGTEKDSIIDAQEQEGVNNGIRGTPGFLLTDSAGNVKQLVSGAQPYDVFKQALASVGVA